jgi:hypothetical protein
MYRCGTRGMAHLGIPDGEARVICDSCGEIKLCKTRFGLSPEWWMKGKGPPGWIVEKIEDGVNRHFCPRCGEGV